MRIVSQDGLTDLPYEQSAVVCSGVHIHAEFDGHRYPMAVYDTEALASAALALLHLAFGEYEFYANIIEMDDDEHCSVFKFPDNGEAMDRVRQMFGGDDDESEVI